MQHSATPHGPHLRVIYSQDPDDPGCGGSGHQHSPHTAADDPLLTDDYNQAWLERSGGRVAAGAPAGLRGTHGSITLPHANAILAGPAGRPMRRHDPVLGKRIRALLNAMRNGQPITPSAEAIGGYVETEHPFARDFFATAASPQFARSDGVMQIYPSSVQIPAGRGRLASRRSHGIDAAEAGLEIAMLTGLDPYLCTGPAAGHDWGHLIFGHPGELAAPDSVALWVAQQSTSTRDLLHGNVPAQHLGAAPLPAFVEQWLQIEARGNEERYLGARDIIEMLVSPSITSDEFDHAVHGGLKAIENHLSLEYAVAIAFHSWSLSWGLRHEAEVVSACDRIAYVSSDPACLLKTGMTQMSQMSGLYPTMSEFLRMGPRDYEVLASQPDGADQFSRRVRHGLARDLASVFEATGYVGFSPMAEAAMTEVRSTVARFTFRRPAHKQWQKGLTATAEALIETFAHSFEGMGNSSDAAMSRAVNFVSTLTDVSALELARDMDLKPVVEGKRIDPISLAAGPDLTAPTVVFFEGERLRPKKAGPTLEQTLRVAGPVWRGQQPMGQSALSVRECLNLLSVMDAMNVGADYRFRCTSLSENAERPDVHVPTKGSQAFLELHADVSAAVGLALDDALGEPSTRRRRSESLNQLVGMVDDSGVRPLESRRPSIGAAGWDTFAVEACRRYLSQHALGVQSAKRARTTSREITRPGLRPASVAG